MNINNIYLLFIYFPKSANNLKSYFFVFMFDIFEKISIILKTNSNKIENKSLNNFIFLDI